MRRALTIAALLLAGGLLGLWLFLFRPFLALPEPAKLTCYEPERGRFAPLGEPHEVFGLGLSFAGHIAESPGLYEPGAPPPVFRKRPHTLNRSDVVPYPDRRSLLEAAANLDPEHAARLDRALGAIPPLLDYEVEIGLVVLAPIPVERLGDPTFGPPLGFFVANDVTARVLIGMAPTYADSVDYLAEGKGLRGFLPIGDRMWIPDRPLPDGWPCVELVTEVNGEVRQKSPSSDIIVNPREILLTVARAFSLRGFAPGDWVITGTPPGVALQTPGWMQRALALLDLSAERKVAAMATGAEGGAFLRPGDEMVVRAGFLGQKRSRVLEPD